MGELLLLYILPAILGVLGCWFLRTCTLDARGRKTPRILILLLVLASLIPVLGIVASIVLAVRIFYRIQYNAIVDNRFTRFWIKS
jgi:uncharacterized SAM-binding protein YcdF (DUF218 family)